MREKASPADIDAVLDAIRVLWVDNPEQRLGQLLLNISRHPSGEVDATRLWNMDETTLLENLKEWA